MEVVFKIMLCGTCLECKKKLARRWCQQHREYKLIDEAKNENCLNSITESDNVLLLSKLISLQNEWELIHRHNNVIFTTGIIELLREMYVIAGEDVVRKFIAEEESIRLILKRYQTQYLIVIMPSYSELDNINCYGHCSDTTRFYQELLNGYGLPYVYLKETELYLKETERFECINILEKCIEGQFPFDDRNYLKEDRVNIPFLLPHPPVRQFLRSIHFRRNGYDVSYSPLPVNRSNRMIKRYGESKLIIVRFCPRMSTQFMQSLLRKGLWVNGEQYQFLGYSSNGLRKRNCYMFNGDKDDIENVLLDCGDFSAIRSVSKQLNSMALLFTDGRSTNVHLSYENVVEIEDIETPDGNFTDGCGFISEQLARKVLKGAGIQLYSTYDLPSVYQIRYQGCKGVVIIDPNLRDDSLIIRHSMKKFNPGRKPLSEIWLCDYSRPYTFGFLNKQLIMLLSGLGIKDDVFLQKLSNYIESLSNIVADPNIQAKISWCQNEIPYQMANGIDVKSVGTDWQLCSILSNLRMRLLSKTDKASFLIPKSRRVFGVCDPLGVLKYGECFFRPTIDGEVITLCGKVIVSKNPCYLLGDVRLLTAVDGSRVEGLHHLVDCIVFPTKGMRPHCAEIAGSDLDGDKYFVSWDEDLLFRQMCQPYDYPSSATRSKTCKITQSDRIEYFCLQNYECVCKIDRLYNEWACRNRTVDCDKCVSLGQLFARSIDASKTGDMVHIPSSLNIKELDTFSINGNGDGNGDVNGDVNDDVSDDVNDVNVIWKVIEDTVGETAEFVVAINQLTDTDDL